MPNIIIYKNQSFSEDEIEELLKELNILIEEQNNVMEEVYQLDIFIKSTIGELVESHPEHFNEYNRLLGELKWLTSLIGATLTPDNSDDIDNPYITNPEPEEPKIIPEEEKVTCKKLFQRICKLTHPDKVKHIKMTKYFVTAKKLYHKGDQKGLQDLLDLILAENININKTNDDEYLILTSRIHIAKEDVERAKQTRFRLQISEDYIIATKYKKEDVATGKRLFIDRINNSIEQLKKQIIEFKTTYFGVS